MVRVRAARSRSGSGVSRDHRARRAEARRAAAVAGVHHADLRDDDASDAARHRRARFDAPLFQLYGATEAGVLFMECEHGRLHPNERHSHVDLVPLPGTRAAGARARDDARPRLDAAAALRHRRRRARGRVARLPLRAASSDGPLLERVEGRQSDCTEVDGETITPLHARRRDPRGARRRVDARAVATRRRHACSSSIRAIGASAARAAAAVGALLQRSIRGERVARHRTRGLRQIPARQTLMRPAGFPAARARLRRRAVHLSRQRFDDAEAARSHRGRHALLRRRSAPTSIAASIRSRKRRPRNTSARGIESRR